MSQTKFSSKAFTNLSLLETRDFIKLNLPLCLLKATDTQNVTTRERERRVSIGTYFFCYHTHAHYDLTTKKDLAFAFRSLLHLNAILRAYALDDIDLWHSGMIMILKWLQNPGRPKWSSLLGINQQLSYQLIFLGHFRLNLMCIENQHSKSSITVAV